MRSRSDNNPQKFASDTREPAQMHKLILKLRWIGMEEEAEQLSARLAENDPADHPIMEPRETD